MNDSSDKDTTRFTTAFGKIRRGSAVRKLEVLTLRGEMTLEEAEILIILANLSQPCRMGELATLSDSKAANTARNIKRLAAQQFVTRSRSGEDGRGAVVELTAAGRVAAQQIRTRRTALLNAVLGALPGGNSKRVVKALEDLSAALEKAEAVLFLQKKNQKDFC